MHQNPTFLFATVRAPKARNGINSEERETGSNGIKLAFWAEF